MKARLVYENLLSSIQLLSPRLPEIVRKKLVEFIEASLYLELGIIAAETVLKDSKLKLSEERIEELCQLIVQKSQEYGAVGLELNLLENKNIKRYKLPSIIEEEDFMLAESGLDDFFKDIEFDE